MPSPTCRAPTTGWKACSVPTAAASGAPPADARLPRRPWCAARRAWSPRWPPTSHRWTPAIWPLSIGPAGKRCAPTSQHAGCNEPEEAASDEIRKLICASWKLNMPPPSKLCHSGFFQERQNRLSVEGCQEESSKGAGDVPVLVPCEAGGRADPGSGPDRLSGVRTRDADPLQQPSDDRVAAGLGSPAPEDPAL